jgi:hypothetical protein
MVGKWNTGPVTPSQSQASSANSGVPPPIAHSNKEALSILREMNINISKTNQKVETLSRRVDEMYDESDFTGYDYDDDEELPVRIV